MNLKLKQLCLALCSLSLLNNAIAAALSPLPTAPTTVAKPSPAILPNTPAAAATTENNVVLNFENADIQTVIKAISKLSGKNFGIDPRVKGTVNIVSEKPISKAESYKVLESALRMQGFATVEADGVIKVLPETDARTYGMHTENGVSRHNPGDQLITKIFIIDKGSATQLANTLRPMISPNNAISVYQNSNALVVTDYASNMVRISKIIDDLNATKINGVAALTIRFKHAVAADVAATLQSYMGTSGSQGSSGGGNSDGPAATVTVDANSNALIIASNVQSKITELKDMALSLDEQAANSNNNLHVVYLRNSDAAHVAEVLRVIASSQDNPDMTPSPASRAISDTSSSLSGSGSGGGSPFGGSGGGSSSSSRPPSSASSSNRSSSTGPADKNAPKVLIQAEPTTNSLIIQAPEAVYRNLRMVITMLDVRRVQVMIEVLIADINATEQGTFGIQWVGGAGNNNTGAIAVSNYAGGGSSLSGLATSAMALAGGASGAGAGAGGKVPSIPGEVYIGLVSGVTSIGGQPIPTISTLADMLAANSSSNILGRPTLLTLDNEEASIFVGQQIGMPTGSFANSAAAPGSISTSVQRQNVGTQIRLKPLVTQSGAIQMAVYEEDSQQNTGGQTVQEILQNGPTLNSRNLKTQIMVDDGQIIALGGLTSDMVQLQMNGIPVLSSIPYLGWLFSWQSRKHIKTNMVIFLRPVIVRNEAGYKALTNQRYRYVMDQENAVAAKGNALFPDIKAVNMENQVPYTNSLPPQPAVTPRSPLLDLRQTANPATSSTTSIMVKQPAPNSVVISNN